VILTLSDSALNDHFQHTECEEGGEIVIMASAATLTNSISETASWLVEIQCDLLALCEWLLTELARRIVFCGRFYT